MNTLRRRRGPSQALAGMPSCGAPSGSHGSVQSNVYAASAGNDMPLILYIRIEFAAEKVESIASLFLRHTKRGIRVLDQHFGIFSISGKDAYSDARARACVPGGWPAPSDSPQVPDWADRLAHRSRRDSGYDCLVPYAIRSKLKSRCDTQLQYCCRRDQPQTPRSSWRDSAA